MSFLIVVAIFATLFTLSYVAARRFGALGLGLTAGVLLAQYGATIFADFLSQYDIYFGDFTTLQVSQTILAILPSLVLLVAGPKYHDSFRKLVGSLLYATMAIVLLLPYLVAGLHIDDGNISQIASYQMYIIPGGIILAVADMMLTHMRKRPNDKKH